MKTRILIVNLIMISMLSNAQNNNVLDTIYANDSKNVALFFPNAIRQGITGSNNFKFTYNREKQQYFGLLQAQPGVDSNLLAITNGGQVYSYIIRYAESISKLNYFIAETESIGNEKPVIDTLITKNDSVVKRLENKTVEYKRFSDYILNLKHETMSSKRKGGMVLKLLDQKYYKDHVYLVFEIKNKSGIDFEIDYLKVYNVTTSKKQKASYQELDQNGIYKYKYPNTILNNQVRKFIYVIPKFVLGKNEKMEIELVELKGSRKLIL